MVYAYMIGVYAVLVKGGKYALTAEGNVNGLPVVPEGYTTLVAERLASEQA